MVVKRVFHGEFGKQKEVMQEFQRFRNKEGAIGESFARMHEGVEDKAFPMVLAGECAKDEPGWKWWLNFGEDFPNLQYLAVRVCANR